MCTDSTQHYGRTLLDIGRARDIVGMSKAGSSLREISRRVGRPKKTISLVLKGYRERGSLQIGERSGRPQKFQAYDRRHLKYELQKSCRVHLSELADSLPIHV